MKENLKMIENMELVLRDLQINRIMKDYMLMENQKVTKLYNAKKERENLFGQMVRNMKDNGIMD